MHHVDVLRFPEKYDVNLHHTGMEEPAHQVQGARNGMDAFNRVKGDDELYTNVCRFMYQRGWVRGEIEGEGHLRLSTDNLKNASRFVSQMIKSGEWVSDLIIDVLQPNGEEKPVELEGDQVDRFAKSGALPPRYRSLMEPPKVPAPASGFGNISNPATDRLAALRAPTDPMQIKTGASMSKRDELLAQIAALKGSSILPTKNQ